MSRWHRLFLVVPVILVLCVVWGAQVPSKGTVVAEGGVTLRDGPGKTYAETGRLPNGAEVEIVAFSGRWYKVRAGDKDGYCFADAVKVTDRATGDDDAAARRPRVTLQEADLTRPEVACPDPRIIPQSDLTP